MKLVVLNLMLHMRKQRHKEAKRLTQGHTVTPESLLTTTAGQCLVVREATCPRSREEASVAGACEGRGGGVRCVGIGRAKPREVPMGQ